MKRIIITGSNGTIGTTLKSGLKNVEITNLDLPEFDLRKTEGLWELFAGNEIVIHLAWNSEKENYRTESIDTENIQMAFNVYQAALRAKITRVIMASSTHADNFHLGRKEGELISPLRLPSPKSPYGASKTMIEALGRYYTQKGLEVVCIRFGGVRINNIPRDADTARRFLTQDDCCSLIQACIDSQNVPENYSIVYGVSKNTGAVHDTSNPFGWEPKEDATKLIKK
ncbi:MAG TPA: NAD(P)-dependent oxidoreductase [Candidatus Paceibacterota bacterium]|nr:NAD(P)-dependent oxidoreductase [Candidatus Paceibacterota bacterium]